ncbi:hypothetical protein [Minwuia sp.]|uniref:hypothetical protein n=1 Tax=Minwuia sp. TaxID=2493630 RepID=UPI003A91A6F6
MITDQDRFSYQNSAYERPTFPYVCGRACSFGKPCPNGPNFNGSCGGTSECTPYRNGDRWECRRAPSAGGPCADGPRPDGTCCMQHPPCTPRPSLRRRRQRISALVAMFVVAAILAFLWFQPSGFQGDQAQASSLMPGPLSGAHSNFAMEEKGCAACHEAHGQGVVAWAKAFVTSQSVGDSCVDCHAFAGPERSPHNATFDGEVFKASSPSADMQTDCVMCHTEHKGVDANIAPMKDQQCNSCHQVEIESFSRNHPDFSSSYPHEVRGAIQFNHIAHFAEHFPKELAENEQPTCVTCHDVTRAGRNVPQGSFEDNCSSCHLQGVQDRAMQLINVPYMEENPFDPERVTEVCGLTEEQTEYLQAKAAGEDAEPPEADEYFYEDNGDNLPVALALLLGVPADDPDAYTDVIGELYMELAESGISPLVERIEALPGSPPPERLLAGLDGELIRQAVCAWMQQREYEEPSAVTGGGWSSDGLSVKYVPDGDGNLVATAWFDYGVNAPILAERADSESVDLAHGLRDFLLSDSGLGNCAKCHAVTQVTDKMGGGDDTVGTLVVEWVYQPVEDRPYVKYDHGPHINLLGPGTLCSTCHKPNPNAEYAASFSSFDATQFQSGFQPVAKETCAECHTTARVKQDCLLCHEYHREPQFNESMVGAPVVGHENTGKDGG